MTCDVCRREKRKEGVAGLHQMGAEFCRSGGLLQSGSDDAECYRIGYERAQEDRKRLLQALRPFAEGANAISFRKIMLEAGFEDEAKKVQAAANAIAFAERT